MSGGRNAVLPRTVYTKVSNLWNVPLCCDGAWLMLCSCTGSQCARGVIGAHRQGSDGSERCGLEGSQGGQ